MGEAPMPRKMLKLLLCLVSGLAISIAVLQLRQQRLELNYQANRLHGEIEKHQAKLWDQQLQIAVYTAPNAISRTVGQQKLEMVPQNPLPARKASWIDANGNPDAE
jgi:cell division protein FtsL